MYTELPHTGQQAIESNSFALQRTHLVATHMKYTTNLATISALIQATKHGTNQERLLMQRQCMQGQLFYKNKHTSTANTLPSLNS